MICLATSCDEEQWGRNTVKWAHFSCNQSLTYRWAELLSSLSLCGLDFVPFWLQPQIIWGWAGPRASSSLWGQVRLSQHFSKYYPDLTFWAVLMYTWVENIGEGVECWNGSLAVTVKDHVPQGSKVSWVWNYEVLNLTLLTEFSATWENNWILKNILGMIFSIMTANNNYNTVIFKINWIDPPHIYFSRIRKTLLALSCSLPPLSCSHHPTLSTLVSQVYPNRSNIWISSTIMCNTLVCCCMLSGSRTTC